MPPTPDEPWNKRAEPESGRPLPSEPSNHRVGAGRYDGVEFRAPTTSAEAPAKVRGDLLFFFFSFNAIFGVKAPLEHA